MWVGAPRRKIRFVYFDLDDTLVDTTAAVVAGYGAALARLRAAVVARGGAASDGEIEKRLLSTFGSTMPREYFRAWLYEAGVADGAAAPLVAAAAAVYAGHMERIKAFPAAPAVLSRLAEEGVGRGVITDGRTEEQLTKLRNAGLASYFGPVFVSDKYPVFEGKPGQAMFADALRAAAAPAAAVAFVGDRTKDVIGANLAGMVSVRILQGWANRTGEEAGFAAAAADYTIETLAELRALLERHGA